VAAARAAASGDEGRLLAARRRLQGLLVLEHLAFAAVLLSGAILMWERRFDLGHPRWFGLKLGLVAFLVLPLEAMHAYIAHVWIARGLRETAAPPFSKDLRRGLGIDEMIRALAVPLLGLGVPLLVWLSLRKPF
jgi:hypothetical protein